MLWIIGMDRRTVATRLEVQKRLKRVTLLQMLLAFLALAFMVLLLYSLYSLPSASSVRTPLQEISALGIIAVGVAATLLFFIRPPQRKPGEQVRY
jgi:hypothetical protein